MLACNQFIFLIFSLLDLPDVALLNILQYVGLRMALKIGHLHSRLNYLVHEASVLWFRVEFPGKVKLNSDFLFKIINHMGVIRHLRLNDGSLHAWKSDLRQFEIDYFAFRLTLGSKLTFLDISNSTVSTLCFVPHLIHLDTLNISNCRMLRE